MLDENLIATLEQSLRQTRNAQNRLMARLREVEDEARHLRQEIEAPAGAGRNPLTQLANGGTPGPDVNR